MLVERGRTVVPGAATGQGSSGESQPLPLPWPVEGYRCSVSRPGRYGSRP